MVATMAKLKADELDHLVNAAAAASPSEQRRLIMKATAGKNVVVKKSPAKNGRAQDYTDKLGAEICRRLSEGQGLRKIAAEMKIGIPSIYRWIEDESTGFREQYKTARAAMAEMLVFDLLAETESIEKDEALSKKVRASVVQWFAARANPQYADSRRLELKAEIEVRHTHDLTEIQKQRIAESWLMSSRQSVDDDGAGRIIEHEPDTDIPALADDESETRVIPKRRRAVVPAKPTASADDAGRWTGGRRGGV